MHAGAQTPRKTPKPLATPLPVLTDAEIISQADDYKDPVPTNQPNPKPQNSPAATDGTRMKELNDRVKKLEASQKSDPDEKQKRLLLNLDILTRAEQRAESLRKQQFEMIDKENAIKTRLNQIEYESRPEVIERSLQMNGSLRPEEIRDAKRKSLLAEKANLETLLNQIQATRANLDASVQRSDAMVEKLRAKMEKDIDDSLNDDKPEN
jgi:hypothetical protein